MFIQRGGVVTGAPWCDEYGGEWQEVAAPGSDTPEPVRNSDVTTAERLREMSREVTAGLERDAAFLREIAKQLANGGKVIAAEHMREIADTLNPAAPVHYCVAEAAEGLLPSGTPTVQEGAK